MNSRLKHRTGLWPTGRSYVLSTECRSAVKRKKRLTTLLTSQSTNGDVEDDWGWCALYTRHRHEKSVAEMLAAKEFEVFLPLYESIRRWKDRKMLLALPLFPCYVFVRGGVHRRLDVLTTPGVHMILLRGEHVAIIPETEIQAIRKAVEGPSRLEPHPFLKCGERVRVTRGSLEGVEGILVRKKNVYRLVLSVDMMAQSAAVEIDASDVEPVIARGPGHIATGGPPAGIKRHLESMPSGA
jgi:transcription antitermination factor NusG